MNETSSCCTLLKEFLVLINLKTSMSNFLILRISTFCLMVSDISAFVWASPQRVCEDICDIFLSECERERDSVAIRCRVAKSVSVLNPLPDCSLECHTVLTQEECVHVCFCTLSDCIRKTRLQSAGALKGSCLNGLETYCKRHPSVYSVFSCYNIVEWASTVCFWLANLWINRPVR